LVGYHGPYRIETDGDIGQTEVPQILLIGWVSRSAARKGQLNEWNYVKACVTEIELVLV